MPWRSNRQAERSGFIEIVGAGPGDPELISVRGKRFLEEADLILYAGSLVPVELTRYAKPGATVRSSASMTLEEQFALMKEFYDKGLFVVRLHTGDPCIYGAIQEQMAFFDEYGMKYHITPGISSFQAAAAALQSQFTIPEKVQTIILTRGEGRTPHARERKTAPARPFTKHHVHLPQRLHRRRGSIRADATLPADHPRRRLLPPHLAGRTRIPGRTPTPRGNSQKQQPHPHHHDRRG